GHPSSTPPRKVRAAGAPGLAALLLPHILPVCSVVAPCHPGAALRNPLLVQRIQATSVRLQADGPSAQEQVTKTRIFYQCSPMTRPLPTNRSCSTPHDR